MILAHNVQVSYTYQDEPFLGTQYVHLTGAAFIQIDSSQKRLLYQFNRHYINHKLGRSTSNAADPETLLFQLRQALRIEMVI